MTIKKILLATLLPSLLIVACSGGGDIRLNNGAVTPSQQPTATPTTAPTSTPTIQPNTSTGGVPAGGSLIIDRNLGNARFWEGVNDGAAVGNKSIIEVDHEDFSRASRISVERPAGEFWKGQLMFPVTTSLKSGDVVLAHFFMRSVENTYESGNSFVTVFLEDISTNGKYLTREVSASFEWVEYYLPATVTDTQAGGNLELKFGFGAGSRAQVFDIAGVELYNYGDFDISQLPSTRPSYEGRAEDASWRTAANERIELHRKGDFAITVIGADGNPASTTTVDINLLKHAYHFGSVTVGKVLAGNDSDSTIYKEKVLELFNQSGPENDLKWAPWEGEWGNNYNKVQTLAGLQWLRDNGLYTRGHVMVWPSKRNLPNLMQNYLPEGDPASANPQAKQAVLDHIDDIASASANYLDEWDVINEPYDNHYLMDAFGDQVMVDWFNRARTNLSDHKLYLNDYSILSAGGRNAVHQQHFEDTLQYLVDNEAPITGIGMQGHFGDSPTGIELVYSILNRYNTAFPELDIRVTEFDVNSEDEELQADYTRDFLTIMFSHPATVGVQLWGFWAGAHYSPKAALFTEEWREKPNATAWKNQIYTVWWNNFKGQTNTEGQYSQRGFYGEYEAIVLVNGENQTFNFTVAKGNDNAFTFSLTD